ncbi:MAG TPA: hypothetical protein VJT71_05695 [Pyrinomonadaceae bacterium]|nr:hypothetical protein [Pyrinomonadaceae bacterium]
MISKICRALPAAVVLFSILAMAGCSSSKFDGKWAGKTSQGKEFRFTVSGGSVTSAYIEFDLTCERNGFCPAGGNIEENLGAKISGDSFSASIEGKASVSGKFESDASASGELNVKENDASCGACVASVAWTARKL